MNPKELNRIFQRGKCLSLDTMRAYNEGKLPSKSTHEVEKHLLECSLCASAIDGLNARRINDVTKVSSNINKRLAVYMNTPPQTPVLSRFGLAMIVSSLVIALGVTIWILTAEDKTPNKELADTGAVTQYQPPADPGASSQILPDNSDERSQTNGAVSVNDASNADVHKPGDGIIIENLPATQPGNEKTLTVDPTPEKTKDVPPPVQDDNTRVAPVDQFLRIKSVVVYPPTTHSDKKPKDNGGGNNNGQLDRTQNSKGEFELDEMPTYPGGNEALKNYILANFKPQKEDKENLKRKSTGVTFQVNAKTGEVSGASLSFPISAATDAELLRVIAAMPKWDPGKKRGTVDVMVGITFE